MTKKTIYHNISIQEKEGSELKITGEILESATPLYRAKALKDIGSDIEIHGFRKGHIPDHVLAKRIGEDAILSQIAELALQDVYPQIVKENDIKVIGRPKVTITKLALGNPIGFTIETAVLPEITLPDYKKIASEITEKQELVLVTKQDIDETIDQILQRKAKLDSKEKDVDATNLQKTNPVLTEEIVKSFGDFKDIDDFKKKIEENLKIEKEHKVKEKTRIEIGEKVIEKTDISLPRILIESELDKMLSQLRSDVERMGTNFDDYIKNIKKSVNDIRKEFEIDAEKRAKLQLIINAISTKENIHIPKNEIEKESEHIFKHHKDADPNRVAIYVETMLTNEKVFHLLENNKIMEKLKEEK